VTFMAAADGVHRRSTVASIIDGTSACVGQPSIDELRKVQQKPFPVSRCLPAGAPQHHRYRSLRVSTSYCFAFPWASCRRFLLSNTSRTEIWA
jgi:hypothetical protein